MTHYGWNFAPAGALADPDALVDVARRVEAAGWDAVFLWDHLMRPDPEVAILDPWVMFGAIGAATHRVLVGPMVTPLPRRRPQVVAKQATALDRLTGGRCILGLGLGVDTGRELSGFGEVVDLRRRAAMLSEGAEVIDRLMSGDVTGIDGEHYRVDGVSMQPSPVQRPRVPMWFAARTTNRAPLRRAARYDGMCVIELDPDQLRGAVEFVAGERGGLDRFDVAMMIAPGADAEPFIEAGATWVIREISPGPSLGEIHALVDAPPG